MQKVRDLFYATFSFERGFVVLYIKFEHVNNFHADKISNCLRSKDIIGLKCIASKSRKSRKLVKKYLRTVCASI